MADIEPSGIFLTQPVFFRSYSVLRGQGWVRDSSSAPYIISEVIAAGVSIVYVSESWLTSFTGVLPPQLRSRVKGVNTKTDSESALVLVRPIAEDLNVKIDSSGVMSHREGDVPDSAVTALMTIFQGIGHFSTGRRFGTAIDVEFRRQVGAVNLLASQLNDPEAIANLAMYRGILASYSPRRIMRTLVRGSEIGRSISLFEDFLDDERYQLLSENTRLFGIPNRARRAVTLAARHARALARNPKFKGVVRVGPRVASLATQTPVPTILQGDTGGSSTYLPPMIPMEPSIRRAMKAWQQADPSPKPMVNVLEPQDDPTGLKWDPAGIIREFSEHN